MTEQILDVVNVMIKSPSRFSEVEITGREIWFKFDNYAFSIQEWGEDNAERNGRHTLYIYPNHHGTMTSLAESFNYPQPDEIAMISYHQRDYPSSEEPHPFEVLYQKLKSRLFGVDHILESILSK